MKYNIKIRPSIAIGIITVVAVAASGTIIMVNQKSNVFLETVSQRNAIAEANKVRVKKDEKFLFAKSGDKEVFKIQRGDKWLVLFEGQESPLYDCVGTPAFSYDGSQFAYSACLDGKTIIVVNGTPLEEKYDSVSEIAFSPDGKKLAYVAGKNAKYVVVLNDMEGKEYQEIGILQTEKKSGMLIFSPDGQQFFYKVIEGNQEFLVVNGQEGKRYSSIGILYFDDDSNRYGYVAQDGNREVTVVNNREVSVVTNNPRSSGGTQTGGSTTTGKSKNIFKNSGRDLYLDPDRLHVPICQSGDGQCNF